MGPREGGLGLGAVPGDRPPGVDVVDELAKLHIIVARRGQVEAAKGLLAGLQQQLHGLVGRLGGAQMPDDRAQLLAVRRVVIVEQQRGQLQVRGHRVDKLVEAVAQLVGEAGLAEDQRVAAPLQNPEALGLVDDEVGQGHERRRQHPRSGELPQIVGDLVAQLGQKTEHGVEGDVGLVARLGLVFGLVERVEELDGDLVEVARRQRGDLVAHERAGLRPRRRRRRLVGGVAGFALAGRHQRQLAGDGLGRLQQLLGVAQQLRATHQVVGVDRGHDEDGRRAALQVGEEALQKRQRQGVDALEVLQPPDQRAALGGLAKRAHDALEERVVLGAQSADRRGIVLHRAAVRAAIAPVIVVFLQDALQLGDAPALQAVIGHAGEVGLQAATLGVGVGVALAVRDDHVGVGAVVLQEGAQQVASPGARRPAHDHQAHLLLAARLRQGPLEDVELPAIDLLDLLVGARRGGARLAAAGGARGGHPRQRAGALGAGGRAHIRHEGVVAQVLEQLGGVLDALVGIFDGALGDQRGERRLRPRLRQGQRRIVDLLEHHVHGVGAVAVQRPAGDHLVGDVAQGVHVDGRADGLGHGLLGGHVQRGAKDRALLGQRGHGARAGVGEVVDRLGHPEVEHLDGFAVVVAHQKDILGLEIAVDQPQAVGLGQAVAALLQDRPHPRQLHGLALLDHRRQIGAHQVLHGDVAQPVVGVPVIVQGDRVGVRQMAGEERLAAKALDDLLVIGGGGLEHLEGDEAVHRRLVGAVDHREATRADAFDDAKAARDDIARFELRDLRLGAHGQTKLCRQERKGSTNARVCGVGWTRFRQSSYRSNEARNLEHPGERRWPMALKN